MLPYQIPPESGKSVVSVAGLRPDHFRAGGFGGNAGRGLDR